MERKGEAGGVRVYDSYAHHPSEIPGDLEAARSVAGDGRLVVAFQPHLVSRTRIFGAAMGEELGAADEVVVLDVYLAREDADPAVTGGLVAGRRPAAAGARALRARLRRRRRRCWSRRARPGDMVLTLGAGTITTLGPRVLELLGDARMSDVPAPRSVPTTSPRPRASGSPAGSGPAAGWPGAGCSCSARAGARGRHGVAVLLLHRARRQGVEVQGTRVLERRAGRSPRPAYPPDEPLARVDLAAIRDRIEALAPVASVDVSRQWPDQVLIRVQERKAVAVVDIDGSLRGMDASGVVFRDFARRPARLPLVKVPGGTRDEALAEGAAVVGALPFRLARKVDYVEVRSVDEISLHLRDGRLVMWGSAGRSDDKAEVLDALLERPGQVYDVSVPGQPTARR